MLRAGKLCSDSPSTIPQYPTTVTPLLQTFIVEDSAIISDNLVATLEEMLHVKVVGTAVDEPGAVAWLTDRANACDLAIIDIFLARGTGLGVLKAARAAREGIKLVVLSNFATSDMRTKCLELGADRVFDKSNEIDALLRYCGRLAGNSGFDSEAGSLDAA
jgi:DNA-binding NarL/FixJ family response regulator